MPLRTPNASSMVRLSGEIDIAMRDEVLAKLEAAAKQSDIVDVDLSTVTYADSTALGLLIGLRNQLRERGGKVRLISPTARVLRLLELAGLDRVFEIIAEPN